MSSLRKQSGRRVGRPANEIRTRHFSLLSDGKWKCNYCTVEYASKTSSGNFTNHIKRNHNDKLSPQELLAGYNEVNSCPPNMVNMGFSADLPAVGSVDYSASSRSVQTRTAPPRPNDLSPFNYPQPMSSHSLAEVNGSSPSPIFEQTDQIMLMPDNIPSQMYGHSPPAPNNILNPIYEQVTEASLESYNIPPQNNCIPAQTFDFSSVSMDVTSQANGFPFQHYYTSDDNNIVTIQEFPNNQLQSVSYNLANNFGPTVANEQQKLVDTAVKEKEEPKPISNLLNRKRKAEIIIKNPASLHEMQEIVEQMTKSGKGREEIEQFVLNVLFKNKIILNAFLRKPLTGLKMIDSRFRNISLSIFGDGLIGSKKDAMKTILYEKCNKRWDPCIFQVYVFSFQMRMKNYCTVELGFQNKSSQRRSCILDCIELPDKAHTEFIVGNVTSLLNEFGVDRKLSDVCVKDQFMNQELTAYLMEEVKVKDTRQKIKMNTDRPKNVKRVKEYFSAPGIIHTDQAFSLQMSLGNYDSLVCQVKVLYPKCIEKATMILETQLDSANSFEYVNIFNQNIKKNEAFTTQITDKLRLFYSKKNKLSSSADTIEGTLQKIIDDSENHIYYLPTNPREKVNLLRLIPLVSYETALKDINTFLKGFVYLLESFCNDSFQVSSEDPVDSLIEKMEMIEIECRQGKEDDVDVRQVDFDDWEAVFSQGLRICNRYNDICDYLETLTNASESCLNSLYVQEFLTLSQVVPRDLSFDKFKKIAFLKAWTTFEHAFNI